MSDFIKCYRCPTLFIPEHDPPEIYCPECADALQDFVCRERFNEDKEER